MGSGFDLGGEDGRTCGGAVSFSAVAPRRPQTGLAFVLFLPVALMSLSLAACERQSLPPAPDAATVLQSITPADAAKYPTAGKHWGNPYLVIRADAVGMLTGIAANEEQILKPQEVLPALAQLPASAWPYGRAVAILVDEKANASESEKVALRRNRGIVAGDLESAHVAIRWIPTS